MCSDSTRSNHFKWKESKFRLGIRKKFFMMRAVRHLNKLLIEIVDSVSLEVFNSRWDGTLRT